jgi:biotin carboxylase
MGEVVAAAGIATPRGRAFTRVQDAVQWFSDAELRDAVVKPVDSAGTDNVWFCQDGESVAGACESVLTQSNVYGAPNRKVLVQERIRGAEYYINTVSDNGIHRVPEIWQYIKRPGPTGSPVYDYEEPVPTTSAEYATLREFAVGVLDALGIISSPSHTEVMLTERGPVLIETGARLGGCTIPHIVRRYFGMSQAHLYAATLLDPDCLAKFDEQAFHSSTAIRFVYLINFVAGVAAPLDWVKRIETIPSVITTTTTIESGIWLDATSKLAESPGYVYLAAQDPSEIERDYKILRALEKDGLYTEKHS